MTIVLSNLIKTEFELFTDHQPLLHIDTPKWKPSAHLERWVLRLQPFKFKVRYLPGKDNPANVLLRNVLQEKIKDSRSIKINFNCRQSMDRRSMLYRKKEGQQLSHKDPMERK